LAATAKTVRYPFGFKKQVERQVEWLINPIVYKIADGLGRGNYATALAPDYPVI